MKFKKITIVIGTRPNFIKVTQFKRQAQNFPEIDIKIIHTGQHYDAKMTDVFFDQLGLFPDHFLNITPGSPNRQTGEIMIKLEELFEKNGRPDLIIVVGDVNSTLAGALTAYKLGIPLAHLESGLRSFDRSMPEEINRILTDELSEYFFITEKSGFENLLKEGKKNEQIYFVGNTMIDTLVSYKDKIESSNILEELNVSPGDFVLMTMHRPATVDNKEGLRKLLDILGLISKQFQVVFPIHPRTLKNFSLFGMLEEFEQNQYIVQVPPLDYFAFQKLISSSAFVITDSGGIQEETTYLKKPCITLRPNTERPITTEEGTNTLMSFDLQLISEKIDEIKNGTYKKGNIPDFWDGNATERVLKAINGFI